MGQPKHSEEQRAKWREAWRRQRPGFHRTIEEVRIYAAKAKLIADEVKRVRAAARAVRKATAKERARLLQRGWRIANKERHRTLIRAWKKRNSEKVRERKRGRGKRIRVWLMEVQGGRCAICHDRLGKETHIDHIVPLALGGPNTRSNLQLTHPACNLAKSALHPVDHARSIGRLL